MKRVVELDISYEILYHTESVFPKSLLAFFMVSCLCVFRKSERLDKTGCAVKPAD